MSMVLYVLGIAQRNLPTSTTNAPSKPRQKLRKPSRGIDIYRCKGLDVVLARTCLTLFPADDDVRTGVGDKEQQVQPRIIELENQHLEKIKTQPPAPPTKKQLLSNDSLGTYAMDEMDAEPFRRTRAKTPCFWIGHLEAKTREAATADISKTLANQYQAVLPPRTFTPFPELTISASNAKNHPKTLRKVKGQQSLRDLVTCQEREEKSRHSVSSYSDSETLVGTPSLGSPTSGHFSWKTCDEYPSPEEKEGHETAAAADDESKDVGFKICLDLLTSELATGLFQKHPAEKLDRASGLQILLMIEAYESVQAHVRQEIQEAHVSGKKLEEVRGVEKTLDNWLAALYALYDQTKSSKSNESLRSVKRERDIEPTKPLRPGNSSSQRSCGSDFEGFQFNFEEV